MSLPTCLTLRTVKGSTLSWAELDNNFICLNNLISAKSGTGGNRWYIPSGETVSVTSDYQYFFYGDILIEGTLDLAPNSQLVVLNGDILMSGGSITGTGSIYDIDLPTFDTKVTGMTYSGDVLTLYQNDGTSFSATVITSTDVTITGGTYDPNTGVATFYNNVGGNFPVSGFLTGYTDINVSSLEYVGNTLVLNQTNNTSFSANTPMFSGGTVSGGTTFLNGLTANTISTNEITLSGTSLTSILDNTVKKYSQTLISPTAGRYTITHNLGTTDISVSLWLAFSNELTNAKILNRLPNSVDVEFSVSPSEDVLVLIMGTTVNSSGVAYIYSAVTVGPNQIAYGDATGLITSNSSFVRNPTSGNIGVGVTSPSAKLHINNTGTDNTVLFEDNTNPDTTPFVIDNSGNVGVGTLTASTKLDVRGTFNLQPSSNTYLRYDTYMLDAQVGSSNIGLTLNVDNFGGSQLRGLSASLVTPTSSFGIGNNTWFRENDKIIFSSTDNYVRGWWDIQNSRLKIGGGGYVPIYSSVTSTLHVSGDFKVDGTNPNSLYVGTNGNVGIGTNNPSYQFTLKSRTNSNSNTPFRVTNSAETASFQYYDNGDFRVGSLISGGPYIDYNSSNGSSTLTIDSNLYNGIQFNVGGSSNSYLGSVGLGTMIWRLPTNFEYRRTSDNNTFANIQNGNGDWSFHYPTNVKPTPDAKVTIYGNDNLSTGRGLTVYGLTGATPNLIVRNDGNVGIGTSTPNKKLTVTTSNTGDGIMLRSSTNDLAALQVDPGIPSSPYKRGYIALYNENSIYANVVFNTPYHTQSDYINTGLNLGIGHTFTTGIGATAKLHVVGSDSSSSNYGLKVQNSGGTDNFVVRNDGNVGIGVSGQNQTHIVEIKDNNPPLTTRKIFGIRDSVLDTELLSISRSAFTIKTSPIIFETENITHKFSYGSTNWYSVIYNQNILSLSTLAQPIFSNPFQDIIRFDSKLVILDPTTPPGTNTPLFVPSNRFYVSGDALIQGRTTDTSLLKVLQPSYGSGTISAISAGTYTQINGTGTNFTRCLNVGETITASGFTLTITQIDNDTSLRATLDPLAIFTGQSYTLQGLTRVNVLNNGNVGIGTSTPDSKLVIKGSDSSSSNYGLKVQNSGGTDNFVLRNDGNVGIGTTAPTSTLDINGTNGYNQLRLRTSFTPTGSTDTRGNVGDIAWDDNNFYWKTSTQWLRVSGQTF